ncbi:MAG: hypothetical protein J6J60_02165 [Clostridia bacterium]|nr:hypothetical protein [Clostridia bacterium]
MKLICFETNAEIPQAIKIMLMDFSNLRPFWYNKVNWFNRFSISSIAGDKNIFIANVRRRKISPALFRVLKAIMALTSTQKRSVRNDFMQLLVEFSIFSPPRI